MVPRALGPTKRQQVIGINIAIIKTCVITVCYAITGYWPSVISYYIGNYAGCIVAGTRSGNPFFLSSRLDPDGIIIYCVWMYRHGRIFLFLGCYPLRGTSTAGMDACLVPSRFYRVNRALSRYVRDPIIKTVLNPESFFCCFDYGTLS